MSADERTMFYSRAKTGTDFDIWTSERMSPQDAFGAEVLVPELSTTHNERPGWLSPDGCRLYFGSDRPLPPSTVVGWNLHVASRPPK